MRRSAFSLVELLVAITIILVLMALTGAAVSAARGGQKKQATQVLIAKLDAIVRTQYASYASRDVDSATDPAARAVALRRMISGDLPDRWVDVKTMAEDDKRYPSPHQQAYIAVWNSMNPKPTDRYAGAECLFMIVMRGGIANCLDCGDLASARIGDKDQDGAFEFWDEWGNPIGFILWPGGLELPADGGTRYFSNSAPFTPGAVAPVMRPLIYSGGPDESKASETANGDFGFACSVTSGNLAAGDNCGNPAVAPTSGFGRPSAGASDNITNLDAEAKR